MGSNKQRDVEKHNGGDHGGHGGHGGHGDQVAATRHHGSTTAMTRNREPFVTGDRRGYATMQAAVTVNSRSSVSRAWNARLDDDDETKTRGPETSAPKTGHA